MRTENAEKREKYRYKIELPSGRLIKPADGRHWSLPEEKFIAERNAGRIYFGVDGNAAPTVKAYLKEGREGVIARTWWPYRHAGGNQDAKREILEILGSDCDFITPKPTRLVNRVLQIATNPQSIILDSFAGSGTTAHATLLANQKDGGNRKFILVECEDYANEITAERVRRVISGYAISGKKREELFREKITWTRLRRAKDLLQKIVSIEQMEAERFDKIKKSVKNGELLVVGEIETSDTLEGLGGEFTFCTLGEPIELDRLLTGESLPSFEALASVLFHTATNQPFDASQMDLNPLNLEGVGYCGESESLKVWLIYKPELEFLKSRDAALTLGKAEAIAAKAPDRRHLVFAPARFVSQKMLNETNLPVEFAPLPFALYRIDRGSQA